MEQVGNITAMELEITNGFPMFQVFVIAHVKETKTRYGVF